MFVGRGKYDRMKLDRDYHKSLAAARLDLASRAGEQLELMTQRCERMRVEINHLQFQLQCARPTIDIPDIILKDLIRLCHPDMHNGSKKATETTQWLLKQRKKG